MAKFVGVDWANKGWFAVVLEEESIEHGYFPTISDLWDAHNDAQVICVDIPIGLHQNAQRTCDREAKQVLGRRGNSLFYPPTREAVYSPNIDQAKKAQEDLDFSVQSQAWSLVPCIREVDQFLERHSRLDNKTFIETHPEVAFAALNGGVPLEHPKNSEAGECERVELLVGELPKPCDRFEEVYGQYHGPNYALKLVGRDDVVDAMVAAIVAKEGQSDIPSLPKNSPNQTDPHHARSMEIAYPLEVAWNRG